MMKYMTDEHLENLAPILREAGLDCQTVHEWILGAKQKKRKIKDAEIRKFIQAKKEKGEEITLITNDENSWEQVSADGLPVIYIPHVIRDLILSKEK